MAKDPLADAKGALASADAYAARAWGEKKSAPAVARPATKRTAPKSTLSARDAAWGQPRSIGDNVDVRNQLLGTTRKKKRANGRSSSGR